MKKAIVTSIILILLFAIACAPRPQDTIKKMVLEGHSQGVLCEDSGNQVGISWETLEKASDKLALMVKFDKQRGYDPSYAPFEVVGWGFDANLRIFDGNGNEITNKFPLGTYEWNGSNFYPVTTIPDLPKEVNEGPYGYVLRLKSKNVWSLQVNFAQPGPYQLVFEKIQIAKGVWDPKVFGAVVYFEGPITKYMTLNPPRVYLLDEPTSFCDPQDRQFYRDE